MIKRYFVLTLLLLLGMMLLQVVQSYHEHTRLGSLATRYVGEGPKELGAANIVTAVVVTYRGLDTLGEVTVLFISAAGVGLLLRRRKEGAPGEPSDPRTPASELVRTAMDLLFPMVLLLGIYIFINGHLTPGGGFQGGAVMASGVMLLFLALPQAPVSHTLLSLTESLSGFGYVLIGVLGVLLAGGFLDNRVMGLGRYGTLFSAGAIPLIYILIGLKVGTELSSVLERFRR